MARRDAGLMDDETKPRDARNRVRSEKYRVAYMCTEKTHLQRARTAARLGWITKHGCVRVAREPNDRTKAGRFVGSCCTHQFRVVEGHGSNIHSRNDPDIAHVRHARSCARYSTKPRDHIIRM